MTGWMWLLATVIGVAILGVVIFVGRLRADRIERDPQALRRSEEATKRFYEEEEKSPER